MFELIFPFISTLKLCTKIYVILAFTLAGTIGFKLLLIVLIIVLDLGPAYEMQFLKGCLEV